MKTRSGKSLITTDASRKRKRDEIQSKEKKQKREIVQSDREPTWETLPTVIIEKIMSHLKMKNPEQSFVNLENQLSVNRHWRRAVQVEAFRTHLTLSKTYTSSNYFFNTEVTRFLDSLQETRIGHLKHLRLHNQHNQINYINQSFGSNSFQLESLTLSSTSVSQHCVTSKISEWQRENLSKFVGNNASTGHCQNLKHFTAKRINMSGDDLSIFLGITTITKLRLQIPAPRQQELVPPRININIHNLVNLKDLDIEYTRLNRARYIVPYINISHLSSNIEHIRLKGACLINELENQSPQPLTKLKCLNLESKLFDVNFFSHFPNSSPNEMMRGIMHFLMSKSKEMTHIYINGARCLEIMLSLHGINSEILRIDENMKSIVTWPSKLQTIKFSELTLTFTKNEWNIFIARELHEEFVQLFELQPFAIGDDEYQHYINEMYQYFTEIPPDGSGYECLALFNIIRPL